MNRCTIPFFGPFNFQIDQHSVSPCCNVNGSKLDAVNGIFTDDVTSIRNSILANERHDLCSKCWSITDNGGQSMRTRYSKHDSIDWGSVTLDQLPNKVQLAFSNKCQMQCIYCNPISSVMWEKELGTIHQGSKDITPVLDLLKKMSLTDIVITGGEPMLNDDCINFLLDLDFDPTRKIILVTNLSYGKQTFDKLLNIINKHPNIRISCSIDDIGDNVSRKYLNWELWDTNFKDLVNKLQSRKKFSDAFIDARVTLNAFNYKKIGDIFRYVLDFRKQGLQRVTVVMGSVGGDELASLNSIKVDKNYKVDIGASDFNLLNRYEKSLIDSVNNMIQNSQFNKEQADRATVFFTKHIKDLTNTSVV